MRPSPRHLVLSALAAVAACGKKEAPKRTAAASTPPAPPRAAGPAEYTVIVKSLWTKRNFPVEYPTNDARFSGLIGASHNASYAIFTVGRKPTRGLERVSEEGKHSPLNDEIQTAIDAGNALAMFETGNLKNFRDSMVTTVRVDPAHPLISIVTMIQPSPDWFAGASGVSLSENGGCVKRRRLTLSAHDAGADAGPTYTSPDRPRNPANPTRRAPQRPCGVDGRARPAWTPP